MMKNGIPVSVKEIASQVKKQFELDLEPVAGAMAEILAEVAGLSRRVTAIENRRRKGATPQKKLTFWETIQKSLESDGKQAGNTNVTHEVMTNFFNTPSREMLKRREAAAQTLEKQRQAEQAEAKKKRQESGAFNCQFDTPNAVKGLKNFDYSDVEARRREHSRMVAQNIKDRVFRRL